MKVYCNVAVMDGYLFKVVENTAEGAQNWFGTDDGNNATFNVVSVCDVTITFDPATDKITITGEGVKIPTELVVGLDVMDGGHNGDFVCHCFYQSGERNALPGFLIEHILNGFQFRFR